MKEPLQSISRIAFVLTLITWLVCPATSLGNLISNGSFEDPVLAIGGSQLFTPGQSIGSAWTVVGNANTNVSLGQNLYNEPVNNVSQFNAQDGLNSLDLSGNFNVGPTAGIQQTVTTTPGEQYALSFYVGRVTPNGGPGGVYPTPATVDVSIDSGTRIPFTNSGITNGRINWAQFTHYFVAAGNSTTIEFLNGTAIGNNEAGLDNVTLQVAVPEPASLVLAVGAVVIFSVLKRHRALATVPSST